MNREEAVSFFVRRHIKQLTDRNSTRQAVKNLRQSYFEHQNLPAASRFSNSDVALRTVQELLKARKDISREQILKIRSEVPFLREEVHDSQIDSLMASSKLGNQSVLSTEDLRRLDQEDHLRKIEQAFQAKANEEAQAQLEADKEELNRMKKGLEEEKKSLDAFKSVLDSIPSGVDIESLVSQDMACREDGTSIVWWKGLGLEADPFADNKGLFGIPESKYEDVVVQTPFVKSYVNRIQNSPAELLGKTIVVYGGWGSGKTTLFQLLAHMAGKRGFLPLFTTINPDQSIEKLTKQLTSQIVQIIAESYPHRIHSEQISPVITFDEIGLCIEAMRAAMQTAGTKGFVIFVDGLHKSMGYLRQSLEFLMQIQNFQERMASRNIPCGILVAGSLDWEPLLDDPSISGSYYDKEKVPPLSEDAAVEAVVRRINSYLPPGSPRPDIDVGRFRESFSVLSSRLRAAPTFRGYLDHVRARLRSGEFGELGISIPLHTETIEYVRLEIGKTGLAAAYRELADPKQHSVRFRSAVKSILPLMYAKGNDGISEAHPVFKDNVGVFYVLRRSGFIVPRRLPGKDVPVWYLSPELIGYLQNLRDKNKMLPQDALQALFIDQVKAAPKEAETIYGNAKRQLREMSSAWKSSWYEVTELLDSCVTHLSRIEKICEKTDGMSSSELLQEMKTTTRHLLMSIMFAAGDKDALRNFDFDRFYGSWYAPENKDDFRLIIERTDPLPKNTSECFGYLHNHAQTISDLCLILTDLIRGEGVVRLSDRNLTTDEMLKLHEARKMFLSQQYMESVAKVTEVLDRKVKDVAYVAMRCIKGPAYLILLPDDIRGRFKSDVVGGHQRTKRPNDKNVFYDMNRSEYSKVLFQKHFRRVILGDAIPESDTAPLKDVWEVLFSLADREAHFDRPSYFRKHSTEIAYMLQWTPRLCEMLNNMTRNLFLGDGFNYRRFREDTVTLTFGQDPNQFATCRLDRPEFDAIVSEILTLVSERELVTVPPIELLLDLFNYDPERTLGMLRAAAGEGLLEVNERRESFAIDITLTEKGRTRLALLKNEMTLNQQDSIKTSS